MQAENNSRPERNSIFTAVSEEEAATVGGGYLATLNPDGRITLNLTANGTTSSAIPYSTSGIVSLGFNSPAAVTTSTVITTPSTNTAPSTANNTVSLTTYLGVLNQIFPSS